MGLLTGATDDEADASGLREVGHLASWSVTSAKISYGVDCLRDEQSTTFWQSDGLQPHLINIQFQKRVLVSELRIFLDFKLDESYTPSKISVRAGTGAYDLKELRLVELEEPSGWVRIPLGERAVPAEPGPPVPLAAELAAPCTPLHVFCLQIAVLTNHQNGRDTHVREVHVYGPRADEEVEAMLGLPLHMTSPEFAAHAAVR